MSETYTLILVRHGNSEWNQKNLFTGWVDVRLTEQGVAEATRAGELLTEAGLHPDIVYTSRQTRAIQTANIALEVADRLWIDVKRSWRLNERHYGASCRARTRRRPRRVRPRAVPDLAPLLRRAAAPARRRRPVLAGARRALRRPRRRPARTESLKLVIERMLPYWESDIKPDLASGKTVMITAHGNSLRALVKTLDGISDSDIAELNIPTGIPLVYELNEDFEPIGEARYLDPEAAAAGAAAVAAQGAKK